MKISKQVWYEISHKVRGEVSKSFDVLKSMSREDRAIMICLIDELRQVSLVVRSQVREKVWLSLL
jgi:hypothetical protein